MRGMSRSEGSEQDPGPGGDDPGGVDDVPLLLINVVGTVAFALMDPYVAIGQTLIYFDLEVAERVPARRWRERFRRRPGAEPLGLES